MDVLLGFLGKYETIGLIIAMFVALSHLFTYLIQLFQKVSGLLALYGKSSVTLDKITNFLSSVSSGIAKLLSFVNSNPDK